MRNRLILTENAYFFRRVKELSNHKVESIMATVSKERINGYYERIIREVTTVGATQLRFSLCIFKYSAKPNFLDPGEEKEIKFAYLLLVECGEYIVISKKNVSGVEKALSEYVDDLDYTMISRLFLSDQTRFEKFSMQNMDISDTAIRRRQVEATDLKNVLSALGASKYILSGMRVNETNKRIAISFNTSRINRLGQKVTLDQFLEYVNHVVSKIQAFNMCSCYLDNFSTPLSFEENYVGLKPASILFNFNDFFDNPPDEALYVIGGKQIPIDILDILGAFERFCPITEIPLGDYTIYKIDNRRARDLTMKLGKTGISLSSSKLKNILLKFGDEEINLLTYINRNQNFIVTFSDAQTVYWSKKLFKDSRLLGNIDHFLSVFIPNPALTNMVSEKGNVNATSGVFAPDTIFAFIESEYFDTSDYMICDDLGDEWADYITIKNLDNIRFYHAKEGTLALSASKFHEVVAQAQKNLGNVFATDAMLTRKIDKWKGKYSGSNIDRLRKGASVADGINAYKKVLYSPNTHKEVLVVVNFISKSRLEVELAKLLTGQQAEHQVIQILWLISSLISSCKEANTDVYIVCQP